MVFAQSTLNCLVNLTETPFFCIDLSEVDQSIRISLNSLDELIPAIIKDNIQELLTDMEISMTILLPGRRVVVDLLQGELEDS